MLPIRGTDKEVQRPLAEFPECPVLTATSPLWRQRPPDLARHQRKVSWGGVLGNRLGRLEGGAGPAVGSVAGAHWLGAALPRPRGQGGAACAQSRDESPTPPLPLAARPGSGTSAPPAKPGLPESAGRACPALCPGARGTRAFIPLPTWRSIYLEICVPP